LSLVFAGAGCQRRAAIVAPPVVIVPSTPESSSPKPTPPDIKSASAANKQPILPDTTPPPAPAKKRRFRKRSSEAAAPVSPDSTTTIATAPAPPAPPEISPQVNPGQQAAIELKVRTQMDETEKNLRKVQGRKLTAGQRDIAEKVRSFLMQAGDAVKASNWTLASNLADKAHVLSEDLLRSL
jgi:hypothetical protein